MPLQRMARGVEEVWRSRIQEDFLTFRQQDRMTDLVLICRDREEVRAHRIVLASFSDFVRNVLISRSEEEVCSLYLPDLVLGEVVVFLTCLYSGDLPKTRSHDMAAVEKVSSLYLEEEDHVCYLAGLPPAHWWHG